MSQTGSTLEPLCRVLVVGTSEPIVSVAETVTAGFDSVSLVRERTVSSAIARLGAVDVHCVVCEFEPDGEPSPLERLRRETESGDTVPIVAVTDAPVGALEAGATDVVDPAAPGRVVLARLERIVQDERDRQADGSNSRDRSILEAAPVVVWTLEADGEIAYANPATDAELGVPPDELEGRTLTWAVHPDDRNDVREALAAVVDGPFGASERVTARVGRPDRTWRSAELQAVNRLEDPRLGGVVVTVCPTSDIEWSDRDASRLDRIADPVFEVGDGWELRYANAAATDLLEGDPSPGTPLGGLLPEALRDPLLETLRAVRTDDEATMVELPAPDQDRGVAVWLSPSASGTVVQLRDPALPSAATETAVRLAESVVDALPDGVAVLEDGVVALANARLTELADTDVVGREPSELFDRELAETVLERGRAAPFRWMEPASGTLALGDRHSVEVAVIPLPDGERTLCLIRERRRSPTGALRTLETATESIREAETISDIGRAVAEAAVELSGGDVAGLYRLEERTLRPIGATSRDSRTVGLPAVDRATIPDDVVRDGDGGTTRDARTLESFLEAADLRAEQVLTVPVGTALLVATTTEPMGFDPIDLGPLETLAETSAVALEGRDATAELRECQSDRTALEATLDRLERIGAIERTLLDASDGEAVYRRLCRGIVSLEFAEESSEFAWIGPSGNGRERVDPQAIAGDADVRPDPLAVPRPSSTERAPTPETVCIGDLTEAPDEPWRARALERGIRSVLSVPLRSGSFRYGTLTVYSTELEAFDEPTRLGIERLGDVGGAVVDAIETRRALRGEAVTELEFVLREPDPLATIAHRIGHLLTVRSVVPRSTGGETVFVTVPDGSLPSVDSLVDLEGIESVRAVGTIGEDRLLELVADEPSIAVTVAEHGGVVRSLTPTDDRTRLVFELSGSADVRAFVDALERGWELELLARRQRERSPADAFALDSVLRERLSERQRQTLEAAYYAGFFEWPRESTGEAVADSLGVSQPTFSRHVRAAQATLLLVLFEEFDGLE
ncbi:bacterio-opsin activator domain-containing protein [Natronococcus sp. A-GB7]|uniref:bacterio-opsin activator domain-containing protein n=1 Tax=Natronococcus sp. A-GB7 TaxID=3037649 RepID=UPI00241D73CF|nr:bacterio-opsin activator domain-containing protein [Natronococcus sp. A-GB7]MDG5819910.1 bacterio-opsin activator domain-containing protein [Natronococcus sp. A-GB7]